MTIGRGIVRLSERSPQAALLDDLRLLLEQQHVARRTVQTLIGSYVALRTSTRPFATAIAAGPLTHAAGARVAAWAVWSWRYFGWRMGTGGSVAVAPGALRRSGRYAAG